MRCEIVSYMVFAIKHMLIFIDNIASDKILYVS